MSAPKVVRYEGAMRTVITPEPAPVAPAPVGKAKSAPAEPPAAPADAA